MICSVSGCDRDADTIGLCGSHYQRHRTGSALTGPLRQYRSGMTPYERAIDGAVQEGECLVAPNIPGRRTSDGYGYVPRADGGSERSHVIVWSEHNGPVPPGMVIRHSCDNRPCIRIDHLLLGTRQDNVQDMLDRDRQQRGERNGQAKLTDDQVRAIREDTRNLREVASDYEVSQMTVSNIRNRKTWRHL